MTHAREDLFGTEPRVSTKIKDYTMTINLVNLKLKDSGFIDTSLDGKFSLLRGKFNGIITRVLTTCQELVS